MIRIPRIVPWISFKEFEFVYNAFYSQNPADKEKGVSRTKSLLTRGKVPHAIESTCSFVEIWLKDGLGGLYAQSVLSQHQLQLMYTLAFIRFVNGIVDPSQKQYASSISSIADTIGLPAWFVDLRHAGTHDNLPSLQLLRSGSIQALKWLHENYWLMQKNFIPESKHQVRLILSAYKDSRKAYFKTFADEPEMNIDELDYTSLAHLSELEACLNPEVYRDILFPVLLESGFLVPMSKKKQCLSLDELLGSNLVHLWMPLLERLDTLWENVYEDIMHFIIDYLGETQHEDLIHETVEYQFTLTNWVKYLISKCNSSLQFNVNKVIEKCLRKPNIFNIHILKHLPIPKEKELFLEILTRFVENHPRDIDIDFEENKRTNKDFDYLYDRVFEFQQANINVSSNEMDDKPESSWFVYNKPWDVCNIGCLPGNLPSNLTLDDDVNTVEYEEAGSNMDDIVPLVSMPMTECDIETPAESQVIYSLGSSSLFI